MMFVSRFELSHNRNRIIGIRSEFTTYIFTNIDNLDSKLPYKDKKPRKNSTLVIFPPTEGICEAYHILYL